MYSDAEEVVYTLPTAAEGTQHAQLHIQQCMEEHDICAIFDDAWLGSRVWEATTTFCDRLCGAGGVPPLLPGIAGSSVLELGAGTGIGGMVAAALGAADVVTTDMESPDGTLNLIRHNIEANRAEIQAAARNATTGATEPPRLRGAALDWTAAPSQSWRAEFEPANGFDYILAAECIYTGIDSSAEPRPVWAALADTICTLARDHTEVYVCSKERGMQLSDDENDAEPRPRTEASDLGDGSLVVQFKRHMEQERGFRSTVVCQPDVDAVQGLWLFKLQKKERAELVPELELDPGLQLEPELEPEPEPEPEPELATTLLSAVVYINKASRTDRRKRMEATLR